ncbi:hypothetical protein FOL46_000908 [Perkinsus olseni]|uniref:Mei2-like C-terminal RNA recognition motif domain-containing protein n=1 Tax=Perkinsus olseni TaxID=32597 RepID=A0A7J6KVN2_PEROL|nr:hypothetical protein FOL46_000908 [Perkinsus olseni]
MRLRLGSNAGDEEEEEEDSLQRHHQGYEQGTSIFMSIHESYNADNNSTEDGGYFGRKANTEGRGSTTTQSAAASLMQSCSIGQGGANDDGFDDLVLVVEEDPAPPPPTVTAEDASGVYQRRRVYDQQYHKQQQQHGHGPRHHDGLTTGSATTTTTTTNLDVSLPGGGEGRITSSSVGGGGGGGEERSIDDIRTRDHAQTYHLPNSMKTTVMLRNIPNKYTQRMLLEVLAEEGFTDKVDFFYLPIDFRNKCNVGYAFINLCSHEYALQFMNVFHHYKLTAFNSLKVCETGFARIQGLQANINHYRNSPVNEVSIPEYRPLLFNNGKEVPFPQPIVDEGAAATTTAREGLGGRGGPRLLSWSDNNNTMNEQYPVSRVYQGYYRKDPTPHRPDPRYHQSQYK